MELGRRPRRAGSGWRCRSLQETLLARPETKVLVASGRYDLVTPYFASRWLIDQLAVPASVRDRYPGCGSMKAGT